METGKDLDPQSCEILQTYVWWGAGGGGGGGASFQYITLKPGKFTNFKMLVSLVSMDFR